MPLLLFRPPFVGVPFFYRLLLPVHVNSLFIYMSFPQHRSLPPSSHSVLRCCRPRCLHCPQLKADGAGVPVCRSGRNRLKVRVRVSISVMGLQVSHSGHLRHMYAIVRASCLCCFVSLPACTFLHVSLSRFASLFSPLSLSLVACTFSRCTAFLSALPCGHVSECAFLSAFLGLFLSHPS